jgi:predicted lipoprotein
MAEVAMRWTRWLPVLVAVAVLAGLPGCKIVSNKDLAADTGSAQSFDAKTYVEKIWDAKVVPAFAQAIDLTELLPEIAKDPDAAGKAHGHNGGAGNPWSYAVKGKGTVTSVDTTSRRGLVTLDLAGATPPVKVVLQVGPVVFGSALRDSLPFIQFGDFVNQIQFAQVSRALNDDAVAALRKALDPNALAGKTVEFAGGATITSASGPITVTPVTVQIE